MTLYEAIYSFWRQPLLGVLFLLLTGQMASVIAAFRDRRRRRVILLLTIPFFAGAMILWLCLSLISWEINFPGGIEPRPVWLESVAGLPAWTLVPVAFFLALLLALSWRNGCLYHRNHLTPGSLKETMDLLPVGIAYGRADGEVLLRNLVMDHLSKVLTGKPLNDLTAFCATLGSENGRTRVTAEGRVWQMDTRKTNSGGEVLLQLTAADITEQAGILADLEARNKKLKDIRLRLEIYNRQAERIIIAQEMLTARMTVHDELGHILLESRRCLNDPGALDEARFLRTLKDTNAYLLREYEQDDTVRDTLTDAVELAEAIGVEVTIAGRIPVEKPFRDILAAAIQECAANAVKHAGGNAIRVAVRREENGMRFSVENNGAAPAQPIRESGGLLSLRALTENQGGQMTVDSVPVFRLTVTMPEPETEPDSV